MASASRRDKAEVLRKLMTDHLPSSSNRCKLPGKFPRAGGHLSQRGAPHGARTAEGGRGL